VGFGGGRVRSFMVLRWGGDAQGTMGKFFLVEVRTPMSAVRHITWEKIGRPGATSLKRAPIKIKNSKRVVRRAQGGL